MSELADFSGAFVAEDKGRKLVFRTEIGRHIGERYVVTKIEMGVRLPADGEGQDAAHAALNEQVRQLMLHAALSGEIPRHLTDQRHAGRAIRRPKISAQLEAELHTPIGDQELPRA